MAPHGDIAAHPCTYTCSHMNMDTHEHTETFKKNRSRKSASRHNWRVRASDLVTRFATEDLSRGARAGASWVELAYLEHRAQGKLLGRGTASGFVWKPASLCCSAAGWVVSTVNRKAVRLQEGAAGGVSARTQGCLKQ